MKAIHSPDNDAAGFLPESGNSFSEAATLEMERLVVDFGRMYRERNEALAGDDIPGAGRIVAVVDFFDAPIALRQRIKQTRPTFTDLVEGI